VIDNVCSMKNTILNLPNVVVGPANEGLEYLFSPDFKRAKQDPNDLTQTAYGVQEEEFTDIGMNYLFKKASDILLTT